MSSGLGIAKETHRCIGHVSIEDEAEMGCVDLRQRDRAVQPGFGYAYDTVARWGACAQYATAAVVAGARDDRHTISR